MSVEKVRFNGVIYRRYPESKGRHTKVYFTPGIEDTRKGRQSLHRDVWKHHNGDIPDGYVIHHKDGNPLNNHIDNLEAITQAEHVSVRHKLTKEQRERSRKHMDRIRPLASAWHSSDDGRKWHSQHGAEVMANRKKVRKACRQCNRVFVTIQPRAKTCSTTCAVKYQNQKAKSRHLCICIVCGSEFRTSRVNGKCCGRSCIAKLGNSIRWGNSIITHSQKQQSDE